MQQTLSGRLAAHCGGWRGCEAGCQHWPLTERTKDCHGDAYRASVGRLISYILQNYAYIYSNKRT